MLETYNIILDNSAKILKLNAISDLPGKVQQLFKELGEKGKELRKINSQMALRSVDHLFETASEIDGIKIITGFFPDTDTETLKVMCDKVRGRDIPVVAVFAGASQGKVSLVAAASEKAQKEGVKAGMLVKEVAILTDGNGGGRPDFAMAGAKNPDKVEVALKKVSEIIRGLRERQTL